MEIFLFISISTVHYRISGKFDLGIQIDALFFVGSQVVAISYTGKVGIWNSRMPRHWQVNTFIPCSLNTWK